MPKCKFTPEQAAIMAAFSGRLSHGEIAAALGVRRNAVQRFLAGKDKSISDARVSLAFLAEISATMRAAETAGRKVYVAAAAGLAACCTPATPPISPAVQNQQKERTHLPPSRALF